MYRLDGYISANLAQKSTGFSEADLKLLWDALVNLFENDHSAARGNMAVQKLYVFKHDSVMGNVQAYKLFNCVQVEKKDAQKVAHAFEDYAVIVDTAAWPAGVHCTEMVEQEKVKA